MAQKHLNPIQNREQTIKNAEANFTELYSDKLSTTGDGSNVTVTIGTETKVDVNTDFATGSKLSVLWGKAKAWFRSLKALAFKDTVTSTDVDGTIAKTTDIPTVNNGQLTIKQNGTQLGTFTANQFGDTTIDIAVSNPNLFINSNFYINQLGQASYTTTSTKIVTVDRTATARSTIVPQTGGGIQINAASGQVNPYIQQILENATSLVGEFLTLSMNIDGTVYTHQVTTAVPSADSTTTYYNKNFTWGSYNMNLQLTKYNTASVGSVLQVTLTIANPNNTIFNWWKLEKGIVATMYVPPIPSEELIKCQRYIRVYGKSGRQSNYGIAYAYNSTTLWLKIDGLETMRTNPTVTAGTLANFRIVTDTGLGSGLVPSAVSYNIGSIQFTVSGATQYARYNVFDGSSSLVGYLYLNAEFV